MESLDKEEGSPELKGQRKREGGVGRGGGTRTDKLCVCLPKYFAAQVETSGRVDMPSLRG